MRFKLDPKLKLEEGDGINVVIDTHSGVISSCNASASLLFEQLVNGATIEELAGELSGKFQISKDQAEADADDFIRRLSAMGLVHEHG